MIPGQKLREVRVERGVSQAEVARRMGITNPAVSAVENERKNPGPEWAARYLAAVGAGSATVYVHVRAFVGDECVFEAGTSYGRVDPICAYPEPES